MTWYAAHLLFYVRFKNKRQRHYPAWENIVLIQARTEDEAWDKAEKRAADDACLDPDDSFTWGGEPAEWVFAGVRKLTTCLDEKKRPTHGTEVTYIQLDIPSKEALDKLIAGEPAPVTIDDDFPDETEDSVSLASSGTRRKAE